MTRPKLSHKQVAWLVIGLLIISATTGLWLWANSGNSGQIVDAPTTKTEHTRTSQQFDGTYITFSYSGTYQAHKLEAKDIDLELSLLTANTNYEKQLAVSVSRLNASGLDGNSAYLLRKSQPDMYASHQVTVDGNPSLVSIRSDGTEQTVFIPHGDKVAVLSFSTTGNLDNLQSEVDALLQTFRWKG